LVVENHVSRGNKYTAASEEENSRELECADEEVFEEAGIPDEQVLWVNCNC
jgi:hypothetical protein